MINYIGFYTLLRKEVTRFLRLYQQTLAPPIITSLLYIFVFGVFLSSKISTISGVSYLTFIFPGLAMMALMANAFTHSSTSIFLAKFQKSIEDVLSSPLSYLEINLAFIIGAMIRGIITGLIIILVFIFVEGFQIHNWFYVAAFLIAVSLLFAAFGVMIGLWSKTFDNLLIFNTFLITPLTFLGGVFYSIDLLPETLQKITFFNPLFYMINGLRYGMLGIQDFNPLISLFIVLVLAILLSTISFYLFKKGYRIKS